MTDFDRPHGNIALKTVKEDGIASDQIIRRKQDGTLEYQRDDLTIEEPLEIRIGRKTIATTMRTPGHDEELAAGFIVSEGLIQSKEQIAAITRPAQARNRRNIVSVQLVAGATIEAAAPQRLGTITS